MSVQEAKRNPLRNPKNPPKIPDWHPSRGVQPVGSIAGMMLGAGRNGSLWPPEYAPLPDVGGRIVDRLPDVDVLFRFVTECCWTWNEADSSIELIPDKEYLRWYIAEWRDNAIRGGTLLVEKSRRLIMSWVETCLELYLMGISQVKGVVCGLNYPKAAEHVWRFWWIANEMQKRKGINLGVQASGGNVAVQRIDRVVLANGSMVENLNQEGASFQGSGYAFVRMEEMSQYRYVQYMVAQAKIVTEGKPGEPGGFSVGICNAYPNPEWKELKS